MIFYLDSKNTQDEAFRVVGDTLPKIPDARHVVAVNINEGTALGTIAAFEAAGRKEDIVVVRKVPTPPVRMKWRRKAPVTSVPPATSPNAMVNI